MSMPLSLLKWIDVVTLHLHFNGVFTRLEFIQGTNL